MIIQFATQSYKHPSLPISAQRCVNMFAEKEPKDAKEQVAVLGTHGLTSFATCGAGPIRGMNLFNDLLYVVSGDTLYSVSRLGVATQLGKSIPGLNPVSMSNNGVAGNQLCIVNGTRGYIYDTTTGFVTITDPNFFSADVVVFFDNYFVLNKKGTNQFFLSNLLDGTTYQATNIGSADGLSGNLVSIVNQQNNLILFGETHAETWYDAGSANFPFQRYDGATVERGCIGSFSTVKDDNSVFFMGEDLVYYRLDGAIPKRVSQHAIELEWKTYKTVSDVVAYSYTYGGHKFIVLTFPSANKTYVYDISTNLWHERSSWDRTGNNLGRWRASTHIIAYGLDLFGDAYSGQIGRLDPTVNTEYGNTIQAMVVSPPVHSDRRRIFHDNLEIDMEVGVGAIVGQGTDPQIMMDYSDDGGRTFKNQQHWSSVGKIGEYTRRVRWTRLGQSRQRVYRLIMSDPVRRNIIAAYSDIRKGLN